MAVRRGLAAIVTAGVVAFGGAGLYAGTLGITTVETGAGAGPVPASCASSATVSPGAATYSDVTGTIGYSNVTVTGTLTDCAYQEARVTVFNRTTHAAAESTTTTPHIITLAEAGAGSFPVALSTPVNASFGPDNYSFALVINSVTTHDAPTLLVPTAGYYGIGLSWTAPTDQGGVSVNGYKIEYATDANYGTDTWTTYADNTNSTATSAFVPSLTPGTQYWFKVTAWNVHGLSPASATVHAVSPVVPYTAPGAPTGVTPSTGTNGGELDVSWTAPVSDGYHTLTGYTIEYASKVAYENNPTAYWIWSAAPGGSTVSGSTTSTTLTGLGHLNQYYVRVTASNDSDAHQGTPGISASYASAH